MFKKIFNSLKKLFNTNIQKEDKYHYFYKGKFIEIHDINYNNFINLIEKLKKDKELKVIFHKNDTYYIFKKTKEKDGWSIFTYIKNKYPESKQFEYPEPDETYVIYQWPECVPDYKKFYL